MQKVIKLLAGQKIKLFKLLAYLLPTTFISDVASFLTTLVLDKNAFLQDEHNNCASPSNQQ